MKIKKYFIVLFFFIVLLNLNNIFALGITPARTTLNFEPNLYREISFSILNSEKKDMSVVFMVRGELADYITLEQTSAQFLSSEESKSFIYTINLPAKLEKPGKYELEIVAVEMPKDTELAGASVGATVAVITQLYLYAPYPNKYLEAEVNVIESGGEMVFSIPIINRGKLNIVNVLAKIDVYNGAQEKVASLETNSLPILSLERKELVSRWPVEVNPGRYNAIVTIIYDEDVTTVLKEFNIGEMFLEVKEIIVRDFSLGEIAKFNALVENKWSSNLKDVHLNIIVYNIEGEVMADFKSQNYDVNALAQKQMVAFWDTGGVREGTYEGKLILKYGEKATEKNIKLKITEDNIEVIGITGQVIIRGGDGINWNNILIIAIIVLIIMNIVWFVVIRKLLKKRQ